MILDPRRSALEWAEIARQLRAKLAQSTYSPIDQSLLETIEKRAADAFNADASPRKKSGATGGG